VVTLAAFRPDGRVFATACQDTRAIGSAQLWDTDTGRPLGPPLQHPNWAAAMAFSPDGKVLATGGYDCLVHLWDAATGKPLGPPLVQVDIVLSLAFSPDGKTLAVGHSNDYSKAHGATLWDVPGCRRVGQEMPGPAARVHFSPDGRRLLTVGGTATRTWDAATGRPLGEPVPETGDVASAAYRPDGRMILVAGRDGTLRLRDAESGRPVGAPMLHPQPANAAVFSPDREGRLILAGYADGSARLWDRASQKPLGPPVVQGRPVVAVAFAPDGRSFLTTSPDGDTRRWPVPAPAEGGPERLRLRLQVRTGLGMGEGQTVVPLGPGEWRRRREELARLEGSAEGALAGQLSDADYHDARARDAEQDGAAYAALWHLDRLIAARGSSPGWLAFARRARLHAQAGRYDQADADYARALALGSPGDLMSWYRTCAADCQAGKRWQTTLWYSDRLLAQAPDDWRLYADRALAHEKLGRTKEREADLARAVARGADSLFLLRLAEERAGQGRWEQAASALATAGQRGPLPLAGWYCHALACLKTGDQPAYRRVCAALLEKAGAKPAPGLANDLAWVCALGPDALADYARPLALAELAVGQAAPAGRHHALNTLGALLYRAGRYREAVRRLEEGLQAEKGQGVAQDWVFLAMAHHRLGEEGKAQESLARLAKHPPAEGGPPWVRLEVELLRREAETLVGDAKK
jgi:tetratricopeptide (TPR) repeat protein